MIVLRITAAQESALECRDWTDHRMAEAWFGEGRMVFAPEDAEALASEICDASNAEDDHAIALRRDGHADCARACRGASVALGNLAARVRRAAANLRPETGRVSE